MRKQILLLAYYHPKYIKPLMRWGKILTHQGWHVTEMYPDAYYKEDVLNELEKEHDVIVYFGHGVPGAWCGFGFISANDFTQIRSSNPNRIILSLSCYSLSAYCQKSIGDVLINISLARCVIGYKDRIKYEENLDILNQIFTVLLNSDNCNLDALRSIMNNFRNTSVQVLFSNV